MRHRNDLTKTEGRRLCLSLLHVAIAVGIVIGAVWISTGGRADIAGQWWVHQYFSPIYSGNTVLDVFKNTFFSSALFLVLALLFGFFAVGQPLEIILLTCRCVGIGASVALMYITSGAESFPSVMVLVLPKALVLSFIAALSVREALKLSGLLFAFLFRDEFPDEKTGRTIKLYFIKFFVLMVMVLLVSVMDSLMNYFFMDLY
ncbi:MAG: hypothetical protein LIO40_01590, partial [Ruminococcus sp.]|nr:hypothetical protein [Ruminococcus sp.]